MDESVLRELRRVVALELVAPTDELFVGRGDALDPRMGELTVREVDGLTDRCRVALIGVPQDIGVRRNGGRPGAADAPTAIRRMLYRLTPFEANTGVEIPAGTLWDLGDIVTEGDSLEQIHDRLSEIVATVCRAQMIPLVLGGGHDTTYAAARGVSDVFGPLGLLNFDAHLDVREPNPDRNSGTSFRMLLEEGRVRAENFVEFGIQSFVNARGHCQWLRHRGSRIITLDEIRSREFSSMLSTALLIATSGAESVYGTLDIDGVRAADAPGVSAPLPDGFAASELLDTASALGRRANVCALDICEVNPQFDQDHRTARLAAHAAIRFVAGVVERGAG